MNDPRVTKLRNRKIVYFSLLALICLTLLAGSLSAGTVALDIYGGVIAGNVPSAQSTGLIHVKKINGRWIYYTALGNPMWELVFDNARLGNDLGVDINGNGNGYYAAQKYAIGQGPADGFTDTRSRWGLLCTGHGPIMGIPRRQGLSTTVQSSRMPMAAGTDPSMGNKPSNKMTYAITHNNSPSALQAGAKNIYASVWLKTGPSPYFSDPYDPRFAASVNVVVGSLAAHPHDPWVRYVSTGEVDELRGMLELIHIWALS